MAGCALGDDATSSTSQDLAAPGGSDMGVLNCPLVHVDAVDPVTGAPTTVVPARLIATVAVSGVSGPHWSLMRAGDSTSIVPMAIGSTGLSVQSDVSDAGTWTFTVTFDSGPCVVRDSKTLGNPLGIHQLFRFRALPPETTGLPLADFSINVTGGTPEANQDLVLLAGTPVSGVLRAAGVGTAGEVRLIADSGPDAVALTDGSGSFMLAVKADGTYAPLLIPKAATLAPHLGAKATGAAFVGASFDLPGGAAVSGTVVDGSAMAISGARVVLRAGALPSGPGVSDTAGAFTLWAEPATYAMSFGADDWPQGSLDGVVVPAGGASVSIAYTVARFAVGGSVVGDDGTTPVSGARVTITSRPLGDVADVVVGGAPSQHAAGRVARVVTTDMNGALPAMQLPAGTYDLIVEPPGPSMDGLTAITEVLGSAATWTLALDKPVPLAGTVTGPTGLGVSGARVTAMETVGLGAAPATTTDAGGHYVVMVDKGAPLQLLVEPPATANLASARLSLAANAGSADVALGPGLEVSGVVRSPTSTPLPGVRVEAYCWSCGSTTPLATSISDTTGTYHIFLPDPGENPVDGGVGD